MPRPRSKHGRGKPSPLQMRGMSWAAQKRELMQDNPEADEQHIEITSLPGDSPAKRSLRLSSTQLSPRRVNVFVRLGIVVGSALLLLLVFPLVAPLMQARLQQTMGRLFPPPPTHIVSELSDDNPIYIGSDIPWAVVSIDGRPTALPAVGTDAPLLLSRGRHLITWHADPFPPGSCVLALPVAIEGTCSVGAPVPTPMAGSPVLLVVLQERLIALPPAQQTALINAVRTAVQTPQFSDTVQPGELRATTQPLRARLRFQVDLNLDLTGHMDTLCQIDAAAMYSQPCMLGEQMCLRLCVVSPWQFQPDSSFAFDTPGWLTLAVVHLSWEYHTLNGQLIAHAQPVSNGGTDSSEHLVLLHILWDGAHWHVSMILGPGLFQPVVLNGVQVADDPACVEALAIFTTRSSRYSQYRIISSRNPALGCLLVATALNASPDTGHDAWYLERFGSLFAANDLAHREDPSLPLPNGYEQELTAQFSTLPGQLISFVEGPA